MAKKKGISKRAQKRANASAVELLEQTIEKQEATRFEEKEDNELFVVETVPKTTVAGLSEFKKRKAENNTSLLINIKQGKKNRVSEKDERQIKTMMKKHSKEEIVSLVNASKKRLTEAKKSKRNPGTAKASFDLWDNNAVENEKKVMLPVISGAMSMAGTAPIQFHEVSKTSLRKNIQLQTNLSKKQLKARSNFEKKAPVLVKVDPAQPGQSYRPDKEQHQDAIGEALSIELRRNEALDYKRMPLGNGQLSEETMALIVGSSDEESSDEEEDFDSEDVVTARQKRTEKLTRTQRNKQKRVKAEKLALEERRRKKKLLSQLEQAKKVAKEIKEEEAVKIARRQEIDALKLERESQPVGVNIFEKVSELDPINAPSLPVALTDELKGGSLRAIKPKGSLLTDRLESMIIRKMANRKTKEKKQVVQGKKRNTTLGAKGAEFILT